MIDYKNNKYGTLQHEGKTLYMREGAHLDCEVFRGSFYACYAYETLEEVDCDEPTHVLYWEIMDPEAENEEDACNWNDYTVRKL